MLLIILLLAALVLGVGTVVKAAFWLILLGVAAVVLSGLFFNSRLRL